MLNEIQKIKEVVVNRIVFLTIFFLTPAYVISILRGFEIGWHTISYYHTLLYIFILALTIFRKKLNFVVKIVSLSLVYSLISILALFNFALAGGHYYIFITIAILSLLINRKFAIVATLLLFISFILIGFAYVNHVLEPITNLNDLAHSPLHWGTTVVSIFSITIIFIYAFGDIYRELISSFEDIKLAEQKYKVLFEEANDAITLLKDGVFFDCNEKASEYFKLSKKELIGKSVKELSPETQADGQNSEEKAMELVKLTLEGETQQFEWQHTRSNGEIFNVSVSLNRVKLKNEIYIQGILRDITESIRQKRELEYHKKNLEELVKSRTIDLEATTEEWKSTGEDLAEKNAIIENQNEELQSTLKHLKETQTQLLQSEKMASLGTLTAGVSHEINNPLNYLSGSYYALVKYFEKHGSKDERTTNLLLTSIDTAVNRISSIVEGLNQFSRDNTNSNEDCDIHLILDNCLTVLYGKYLHRIVVKKELCQENVIVEGNIGKLHQVFLNILQNSIQAIEKEGQISIKTHCESEEAIVIITDTGCGISEENLPKITDPFFTTKDPGVGTGLGLSISYSIIQDHRGKIQFESEEGSWTKATITLPIKKK